MEVGDLPATQPFDRWRVIRSSGGSAGLNLRGRYGGRPYRGPTLNDGDDVA